MSWNSMRGQHDGAAYNRATKDLERQSDYNVYKQAENRYAAVKQVFTQRNHNRRSRWNHMGFQQKIGELGACIDLATQCQAAARRVADRRYFFYYKWNAGNHAGHHNEAAHWFQVADELNRQIDDLRRAMDTAARQEAFGQGQFAGYI